MIKVERQSYIEQNIQESTTWMGTFQMSHSGQMI